MTQAGIIDGLAQLELARGDLDQAAAMLATVRPWTPESPKGSWYYGLWTCVTRGRLLLHQGSVSEALQLLGSAVAGAKDLSDPILATTLELLLAEALGVSGDLAAGAEVLVTALERSQSSTIDLFAEASRVIAQALAFGADPGAARPWFERAACALASVDNRLALTHVFESCGRATWRRMDCSGVAYPLAPRVADLPRAPRQVVRRLDACTSLLGPTSSAPGSVVERTAALLDCGAYAPLLGHEVMALLTETGCAQRAVLAARRHGRRSDVVEWTGCSWPEAQALAARPGRSIELGAWQEREYTVALQPPAALTALVTLLSIERLVASALFQAKARSEERERVALWPIQEDDESGDALFLCEEMRAIVASARKVAATGINVLITGETGTGKEVLARVIHAASPCAHKPFVPFNCTAVPRDLVDSQLFGYRRGAFTGAVSDSLGVVREAAGGTLFLDEIGDLSLDVQPKLLRFLESSEIQPLGDPRPQHVAVRVIASTNRDLEQLVAEGRFREDLFYRLNVVPLRLPPLRERREEIPPLAEHFLRRAARECSKDRLRLAEETLEYLVLYRWPGNVRQIVNEMRRLAALAEPGAVLMPEHLDPAITAGRRTVPTERHEAGPSEVVVRLDQPHAAAIEHLERAQIRHALTVCEGRVEDAARMLGLSRKGLYLKRQRLGIE
jgi:DNA-binding NtrC family response regulator